VEEITLHIIRDLPSTGMLILFFYFVARQFDSAIKLIDGHLRQQNELLRDCLKGKSGD
jgi:hypothetical protein